MAKYLASRYFNQNGDEYRISLYTNGVASAEKLTQKVDEIIIRDEMGFEYDEKSLVKVWVPAGNIKLADSLHKEHQIVKKLRNADEKALAGLLTTITVCSEFK